MATIPHQNLRREASLALRAGDHPRALEIYRQLEKLMPDQATWPERIAGVYHEMGRSRDELQALLRTLPLQIEAGEVLAAIATCKLILDIEPDHPSTLESLHLLYTDPAMNPRDLVPPAIQPGGADERRRTTRKKVTPLRKTTKRKASRARARRPAGDEAPLLELELTRVIPGARAMQLSHDTAGGVSEIPLDETSAGASGTEVLDLRLEPDGATAEVGADPAHVRDELIDTPLFGSLEPDTLHRLTSQVRVVTLAAGAVLFREGDRADALYVVVDGAVVPIAEGPPQKRLAVLEKGAFFGEIGLVTNQPRNATIEALVDTRLIAIDRRVVWSLIRGEPALSKVLLRFLRERLIDRHLRTHRFFETFARAEQKSVARQFRFLEVRDQSRVVEQGRQAEGLFIVLAGAMSVVDSRRDKILGTLGPGDLFGGGPLLCSGPSQVSVIAQGKCWVLMLAEERLRRILEANPRLEGLLAEMARRMGDGQPLL